MMMKEWTAGNTTLIAFETFTAAAVGILACQIPNVAADQNVDHIVHTGHALSMTVYVLQPLTAFADPATVLPTSICFL